MLKPVRGLLLDLTVVAVFAFVAVHLHMPLLLIPTAIWVICAGLDARALVRALRAGR